MQGYLIVNNQKINLSNDQSTVGRLNTNFIPINDPTVSKNHAIIFHLKKENKFYVQDLSTVNGTYLNGKKLQPQKRHILNHKDSLQFGKRKSIFIKDMNLYYFYKSEPSEQKKGKINLKNYCYQLDSDDQKIQIKNSNFSNNIRQQKIQSDLAAGKIKDNLIGIRKLKIPDIADYLQLDSSLLSQKSQIIPTKQVKQIGQTKKTQNHKQKRVELPLINNFNQYDYEKLKAQQQNKRNVYLIEQYKSKAKQEEARALKEENLRLQIQKIKYEQSLIRKQFQLQNKIKQQQARMNQQRKIIEQQLLKRQQERREAEIKHQKQQQEREAKLIERMKRQKQEQLAVIKAQQQQYRKKNQNAIKEDFQNRKRQLQLEAQALTKQYQQIYLETIKKMKNDIQKQESIVNDLQSNIQNLSHQKQKMTGNVAQLEGVIQRLRSEYLHINGRNKAFILYASELQNRIDQLKQKLKQKKTEIYSKLKQDIVGSRKLLTMKKKQLKSIQQQIKTIKLSLNLDHHITSNDALRTIFQNHESLQTLKQIYYQYLTDENNIQNLWEKDLQQNSQIERKNNNLLKQINSLKKQLIDNMRQNCNRLCDQRLHLLKCLHYLSQDKKKAAKFLIEEMVTVQQQIKQLTANSEITHDKIHQLIVNSQRKKKQNSEYSQILFGAESTAHHFDNMKVLINQLMEVIAVQKDPLRIKNRLKLSQQIQNLEVNIQEQLSKCHKLKQQWRQNLVAHNVIMVEKNPIVFFGDVLIKKQIQIETAEHNISINEKNRQNILLEINSLEKKKIFLSDSMEKYKREELQKIRKDIL